MLAKVLSYAVVGLEGAIIEVDISPGLPSLTIVGLTESSRACQKNEYRELTAVTMWNRIQ